MIDIRDAAEADVGQVRDVFVACYGADYAYPQFYDEDSLKKMIFDDETVMLVAEESGTGRIVGTASVLLQVGAYADLVGEFGRLAVHPDCRRQGIGNRLMDARVKRVCGCLHVGLVENRAVHSYSQKISAAHGFVPVGYCPMKTPFARRESVALFAQYFGEAFRLRRNNPRVIPEVYRLADVVLQNCGLPSDPVVDDEAPAFPHNDRFELDELTAEGYATLLRFQRGRVRHRDVFGPIRLHYGLFKLQARHSQYILARENGQVVGAVGFIVDECEKNLRIFELISLSDQPIRFLLSSLLEKCRDSWGTELIEVDVNADSPAMQRTLLELGFLPVAYVPSMVFHDVERLDAVKMFRLLVPFDDEKPQLVGAMKRVADIVIRSFATRDIHPRVAEAMDDVPLFAGLNHEQAQSLAAVCSISEFQRGEQLLVEGGIDQNIYVILEGQIDVTVMPSQKPVASLGRGDCLGEMGLLTSMPHSATATARDRVTAAIVPHQELVDLVRLRPDIGVVIYRNLAVGIGKKLRRVDYCFDSTNEV